MGRGIVLVLSIGLAALAIGSCGRGDPGPAVAAVTVTPASASIFFGETVHLEAVVTPAEARQDVTWSSSDEHVASVSDTGLVLGKAGGSAEITARSTANASKSGSATVEVSYAPVTGVTIAPAAVNLLVGESVALSATIQPATANPAVTWSSSAEGVALVSAAGLVTGVGAGTAQITATSVQDPSILDMVSVAVVVDPADWVDCGDATPISSDITVDTTLPLACYHVTRVVDVSASLTVQPGTVFQFDNWAGLRITATGSLRAEGTVGFPITFTSRLGATNTWYGVGIFSDSPDNVLEHVLIEKAGQRSSWVNGYHATALYLGENAGVAITDSIFREVGDDGVGLMVHGRTSHLHAFARNAFDSNEGAAMSVTSHQLGAIGEGNVFDLEGRALQVAKHIAVRYDQPLRASATWRAVDVPYRFFNNHFIDEGSAVITIAAGARLEFTSWAGLAVQAGALRVEGESDAPVTFTSASGVTNDWYGLGILSPSDQNLLRYAVIENAGRTHGTINGHIATNAYLGPNGRASITGSTFRTAGNNGYGIYVSHATSRLAAFTNNTFDANQGPPMRITSQQLGALGAGNTFALNAPSPVRHVRVDADGPILASATWPAVDVPYRFSTTHFIDNDDSVITIAAGARLEFTNWAGLAVQAGALRVEGESDAPVTFTSASGVTNDWHGLGILSPSDQNLLRYAVIENAGRTHGTINGHNSTNVYLGPNGRVSVTNSTFRTAGNNGYGIYVSHATSRLAAFTNNTFDANQGPPMRITSHQLGALGTGNVFGLNAPGTVRYVRVDADGPILASATWPAVDVPYRFFNNHFIDLDDAVITILPGANLTFDRFAGLRVNAGALRAIGTAAEGGRITFGRAVAEQGWYGVGYATVSPANELRYVTITGASAGAAAIDGNRSTNLHVSSIGRVAVTHSAFNDAAWGIYIENGGVVTDQLGAPINPETHGSNTFSGNTTGNVRHP